MSYIYFLPKIKNIEGKWVKYNFKIKVTTFCVNLHVRIIAKILNLDGFGLNGNAHVEKRGSFLWDCLFEKEFLTFKNMENETCFTSNSSMNMFVYNKFELQVALKFFVLHADRSETLLIGLTLQNITWVSMVYGWCFFA